MKNIFFSFSGCPPFFHFCSFFASCLPKSNKMTTSQKKRAKFVFVPAHLNEPLEEWEVEYTEEQAVECLLEKVKVRRDGRDERERMRERRESMLAARC